MIAAHASNQTLYPKLPYDSLKSFSPVSLLVTAPLIVCVTNSLPAKTPKELVELARAKPGTLTFASSGVGAAVTVTVTSFVAAPAVGLRLRFQRTTLASPAALD